MTIGRKNQRRLTVEQLEPRTMLAGDPLANWNFDATSGTDLIDSQAGHNGVLTGAPTWAVNQGTRVGALRLYSDSDGATVATADAPLVQSVSLWFKADTTRPVLQGSSSATRMVLFEAGDSTRGVSIYIYNNLLYVGAWNNGVSGWTNGTFASTNLIRAGRWHQVVLTLSPSLTLQAGGLKGYLDGAEFGSVNGANIGSAGPIGFGKVDGSTRFHDGVSSASNNRGFAGFLDEARIYGETLTAGDVVTIRDETNPLTPEEEYLTRESGRVTDLAIFRIPNILTSEHFAIKWGNNNTSGLAVNPTMIQQNLNRLEQSWDIIVEQSGMEGPPARNQATSAPVKFKINVYVLETGLWVSTGGGAFAGPDAESFGALYISPWAMGGGTTTGTPWGTIVNTTVTPHEFTHVLQFESGGFQNSDFSGPFWETHANYGASLVSDIVTRNSINGRYGQRRHRYSLATDFRYEAHPFLNFLAGRPEYGPDFATSMLWEDPSALVSGADPWQVLRNNFASDAEFASVYADYVASSVTYKALYDGALLTGSPAIPAHNTTTRLFRTYLEPVGSSPGWYQVPEQDTPEQYGANIVKLTPVGRVAGQPHTITVNLDGYVNPGQSNGNYATLVAISGSGASVQERFSPTWQNGEMTFELAANETDIYLTVTAIPSVHRNYIWSHPFHAIGNLQKIEQFPYRVSMSGAVPVRSETPVARPAPNGSAVRHMNPDGSQGGWKTVSVPATVYLGPNVWVTGGSVSGNARIEDYATITGGSVNGSAIVRGNARVQAGTVTGNAIVEDYAVIAGGTTSEFARVKGDALVSAGQIRGNALLLDYATVTGGSAVVAGDTVIKGYGVVDNAQMNGNALVAASGLAAGTGLVTNMGVQFNGEPASQEIPLMSTQYNNLFAQYNFASADNNAVWDSFNTTYGWVSSTPPQWSQNTGDVLTGVLQFQNDSQFVELSPELADLRDYTLAAWVRWDGSGDANQRIIEFGRDASNIMYLQPTSSGGGAKFVITYNGVEYALQGSASMVPNTWTHVAVTVIGNTAKFYINGTAVATRADVDVDPYQLRSTYGMLGRGLSSGGFHGMIDSFRMYSKGLASNEIVALVQQVYPDINPTGSDSILILQFARHDGSGLAVVNRQAITNGDLYNSSSSAPGESPNPGGMTSSGATYATYVVGTEGLNGKPGADGFAMNSGTGYVYFADAGSALEQALATSDAFSIFARAKRNVDTGDFEFVVGRPSASTVTGAWSLGIDQSDHIVASMGGVTVDTGATWAVNAWHEVGLVYTGTGAGDGWVYVYLDGVRDKAFQPGAIDTQQVLHLAAGLGGANRIRGWIDHVEFWDHAVGDEEVAALSNVTASALPGDYNRNGAVDSADYTVWRNNLGTAVAFGDSADGTGNGLIELDDFALWKANFGRSAPAGGAASAVEPSTPTGATVDSAVAQQSQPTRQLEYIRILPGIGGSAARSARTVARDSAFGDVGTGARVRLARRRDDLNLAESLSQRTVAATLSGDNSFDLSAATSHVDGNDSGDSADHLLPWDELARECHPFKIRNRT